MAVSVSALSSESPFLPTEGLMPAYLSRSELRIEKYWELRSESMKVHITSVGGQAPMGDRRCASSGRRLPEKFVHAP